jgi:ATP-dependent Clp endopeptidase proteolytic subunit ClpP
MKTIKIYDSIDPFWGYGLENLEADLASANGDDVHVKIQSGGGSVFEGLAIYNTLKSYEGEVTTEIVGISASIASIIFLAGSKRIVNEVGFLMIHEAWTMTAGGASDLREDADLLDQINSQILDIYQNVTGFDRDELKEKMSKDTYMGPKELLEMGFVTEVKEGLQLVASINNFKMNSLKQKTEKEPSMAMTKEEKAEFEALKAENLVLKEEGETLKAELETKSDEQVQAQIAEGIKAEKEREASILASALHDKQKPLAEKLIAEGATLEGAVMAINKDFIVNKADYMKPQVDPSATLTNEAPSASTKEVEEAPEVNHKEKWMELKAEGKFIEANNYFKENIKGAK